MLKKVIIVMLMLLYQYTLVFDIFLNNYFKIPTCFLFGIPLILFFPDKKISKVEYDWYAFFYLAANLLYYAIGQGDLKSFIVKSSIFLIALFYFKAFIGENRWRLKTSVIIFYLFLGASIALMFADHLFPKPVDIIRAKLLGSDISQSPSGISTTIFTFGYQLSAFVGFVFVYTSLKFKNLYLTLIVILISLLAVWYGMQRSALIAFVITVFCFVIYLYRQRSIPIIAGMIVSIFLFFTLVLKPYASSGINILSKTNLNNENGESRTELLYENLKIASKYPFGLVFYGKQWSDAIKGSYIFSSGITSHNAYLMFITYLGPILGCALLLALYYPIYNVMKAEYIVGPRFYNVLFGGLLFSFLAVSINAMFHNGWLLNGNGPTVYLYIAVLHVYNCKVVL